MSSVQISDKERLQQKLEKAEHELSQRKHELVYAYEVRDAASKTLANMTMMGDALPWSCCTTTSAWTYACLRRT